MEAPIQTTFHGLEPSESLQRSIEEKAHELQRYFDQLITVRTRVELPHRHQAKGNAFHVKIELVVPGENLLIDREPERGERHTSAEVAVRDAFKRAKNRLKEHARQVRGDVKAHGEDHPSAVVARIADTADHGFLRTRDGREIYFHRNAVIGGDFFALEPGSVVRFVEEAGDEGPQASTVWAG